MAFGCFVIILILVFQKSKLFGWVTIFLGSILGFVGAMGIFQYGPLSKYLYQDSITFRGDYWRAGLKMFEDNWVHGVGIDSYGDFYRMYRDSSAANRRGLDMVSNSAHNLLIDLAATGGLILALGYLAILGVVGFTILKEIRRSPRVSLEFKFLVVLWLAFNLQTLISINVPGLAIWGWIFSGLLLGYDSGGDSYSSLATRKSPKTSGRLSVQTLVCVSCCILLVSPLVVRDIKLANAFAKDGSQEISRAVLIFPRDVDLISGVAIALGKIGQDRQSLALAKLAVAENSNFAKAWQVILGSPEASVSEKNRARKNLIRLDPILKRKSETVH
jgi:hypothetical protein